MKEDASLFFVFKNFQWRWRSWEQGLP